MTLAALMIQGTSSDAGKSSLVAGLGRVFTRRGLRVRPFKPQNMSNNAAVTPDGGEIGRAQQLQARACQILPSVHMNPILLKPQSDIGAQIIVQGKRWGNARAADYHQIKAKMLPYCLESFDVLAKDADLILVEGAGSAAEINLRKNDIANMGFAEAADLPVLLLGDIERGGVIAQLLGTLSLLPPSERKRIRGFMVNKFRGDQTLFSEGMDFIAKEGAIKSLGLIPFFDDLHQLPAEDALGLAHYHPKADGNIHVAVPMLPHIANFDDLDPLRSEKDVVLHLVPPGKAFPGNTDLIILPGSKTTMSDLEFFRKNEWDIDLKAHIRRGGWVLGLCGGYQMLGKTIRDPNQIEGEKEQADGLGHLDVHTTLLPEKRLALTDALDVATGQKVKGYEIHIGRTEGKDCSRPMLKLEEGKGDGAIAPNRKVMGCYLHGIFSDDSFRHAFLNRIRKRSMSNVSYDMLIDEVLDRWADHLERHLDCDAIWAIANAR